MKTIKLNNIEIGKTGSFTVIAGPCAIESQEICCEIASHLIEVCKELNIQYIFKASFDKANRTSQASFRSIGIGNALGILSYIKEKFDIPVLTDIHETSQVERVAHAVDVIQIPAFLCRQTDLLVAVAKTNKIINVKKGQFLSPQDAKNIIEKVESVGNQNIIITERGTTFGYNNLVVDMRSFPIMRGFGHPVFFDATHSIQTPGGMGNKSGGDAWLAPYLARGAVAVGCDGLFIETHPNPAQAKSDQSSMIPLKDIKKLLSSVVAINKAIKND